MSDPTVLYSRSVSLNSTSERYGNVLSSPALRRSDSQIMRDALVQTNTELLLDRWPYMGNYPEETLQLASSIDPFEAATQGSVLNAQHTLSQRTDAWNELPDEEKRSLWGQLTEQQQQGLIASGGSPPQTDDNSWIGDILDAGAKATGFVLGGVGSVIDAVPGGSQALSVLTHIGNAPLAVYRGIRQMHSWQQWVALIGGVAAVAGGIAASPFTAGGSLSLSAAGFGTLSTLGAIGLTGMAGAGVAATAVGGSQYINSVRESWDGERAFLPDAQVRASNLLNQSDLLVIAKDIAAELDPYQLAVEFAAVGEADDPRVFEASISRVAEMYADKDTPEFELVMGNLLKLYAEDEFRDAVKVLQQGKISIGRDVARFAQLDPDSDVYRLVSGAVDGLTIFALDPLLAASPAVKLARFAGRSHLGSYKALRTAARNGAGMMVSKSDNLGWRIDLGETNKKIRAMDQQIIDAVNANDVSLMPKNMRPVWDSLRTFLSAEGYLDKNFLPKKVAPDGSRALLDRSHLYAWMKDASGQSHIAQGISTVPGLGFTAIKPISNAGGWGTFKKNLREYRDELIDANPNLLEDKNLTRLEEVAAKEIDQLELGLPQNTLDTPMHDGLVTIDLAEPLARQTLGAQLGRTSGALLHLLPFSVGPKIGTFLDGVSNMAPKRGYIVLDGTEAADEINNFVNAMGMVMGVSKSSREKWIQLIAGQGDVAQRVVLIQHFYDSIFQASGFKDSFRGKAVYEEFMQKFNQTYGVGGIDEIAITTANGTQPIRTGVMPGQSKATAIAIPDVREMIKAQRLDKLLGEQIGFVNRGSPIDWYTNRIWKPSVVLRIGFIPRAIGEEALAWVARGTTGTVLAENRARKLLKMEQRDAIVNRLANGQTIEVIHDGVKNKLQARMRIDDLTLAERRLLAGWRSPNDVRRLERIITRRADATSPLMSAVLEYEKFLRKVLDPNRYVDGWQTSGRKRFVDDIDREHPVLANLLLGKEHSWRRLGTAGLNQRLISHARAWHLTHADATARQWSAGSISYNTMYQQDPALRVETLDDGTTTVKQRLVDTHAREIYTPEQSDFAYSTHRNINEILEDEYFGEQITQVLGRLLPESFDFEDVELLQTMLYFWREIDWATQSRYIDARFNRPDRLTDITDKIDIDADTIIDSLTDPSELMSLEFRTVDGYLNDLGTNERAFVLGLLYEDSLIARLEASNTPLDKIQQRFVDRKIDVDVDDLGTFYDNFVVPELLDQRLLDEFMTLSIRPDINEILQRSRRSITVDGQYVANRVPTNHRRVYVPEILDFGPLRERIRIEQDALGGATVANNSQVAMNIAEDLVDQFPQGLTDTIPSLKNWDGDGRENAVNLLANSIFEILENQYYFASSGWLRNAGFTDPRIARAIGDILSHNQLFPVATDAYSMGYLDIPNNRLKLVGDEWENMRVLNSQSGGSQMISWDEEVAMGLDYVRGTVVPDLDEAGIPMFGVSELDATQMQLSAIVQHIKQSMLERGKTVYRISPDTKVYIAKGKEGRYEQVKESELLSRQNREQLFVWNKEKGDFVNADFDDRALFSPEHIPGAGLMHQVVTPAVMDRLDEFAGFPRIVRKNVPNIDPVTGKATDSTDFVRATWSRASDVDISLAPDEVVGPKFKDPEVNTWDKVLTFGFDRVVTPMIDSFLREPMAFHHFILAREQNMTFLRNMLDETRLKSLQQRATPEQLERSRHHRINIWNDARDDYYGLYDYIQNELWIEAAAEGLSVLQYLQKAPLNKLTNISKRLFGKTSNNLFTDNTLQSLNAIDRWMNHVDEISSVNAMRNLEPFLDTAENKSMFSQYTKNLLPFWYAEENFIKRWFRTAQTQGFLGLETVRKAQLGYMGLRHAGIIRTDENGNDWVVLPGSGAVTELISRVVPGAGTVPVGVLMQTSTNSLLPGFSAQAGSPSISPFATLPLAFTSAMFPELQNFERAFAGEINVDRSLADKFFPPSVMRFQRAITSNENDAQFASAMVDAMIMLEARGEGLAPNHTSAEKQEYMDQIRGHARIIAFSRAVLGFVSPGSPSSFVSGEDAGSFGWWTGIGVSEPKDVLNAEYQRYLLQYGYEEGISKFLEENKYADVWDITNPEAMTVSSSETITGGRVPTTEESLQWYDSNETWAKQNPYAAAWLAPNDEDHKFSQYAYGQTIIQGLRRKFSPLEMVDELHYKNASVVYYPQKDYYDRLRIEHANDPNKLAAIEAEYDAWRTNFLAVHPVFADRQMSPDGRNQRQNTLNEMRRVVSDPLTPQSPALLALGQLIRGYDELTAVLASNRLGGRSANNMAAKRQILSDWEMWVGGWLLANPSQKTFYDAIIARELEPLVV